MEGKKRSYKIMKLMFWKEYKPTITENEKARIEEEKQKLIRYKNSQIIIQYLDKSVNDFVRKYGCYPDKLIVNRETTHKMFYYHTQSYDSFNGIPIILGSTELCKFAQFQFKYELINIEEPNLL